MKAVAKPEEIQRDGRCIFYELVFCFCFGVFLEAQGPPSAVALALFGSFFFLWICRLIDIERAG